MKSEHKKAMLVRISPDAYAFLDSQLRAMSPGRKRGFPKTTIFEGFFKAIVLGLHRPDHYPLTQMIYRMCLAAVKPDDVEGQRQITELFIKK